MECCNTLQYLEGAAYIAIVLAVIGVPHMLTYYFERRERAADRAAAERQRMEDRAEAERRRQDERADADRRHLEMMTALVAIAERNGHTPPRVPGHRRIRPHRPDAAAHCRPGKQCPRTATPAQRQRYRQ